MELRDIAKQPIEAGDGVGEDLSYSPEYEALEAEIGKLSSPSASGTIDWARVVTTGTEILGSRSKDLTVACYLAVALTRARGLAGVAEGVHILTDLLSIYWVRMFPPVKRLRKRRNALAWWAEKTEQALEGVEQVSWESERRAELMEDLERLESLMNEHMDDAPMLRRIADALDNAIVENRPPEPLAETPPDAPAEQPDGPAPAQSAPAAAAAPAPAPVAAPVADPPVDGEDPAAFLSAGLRMLSRAGTLLGERNDYSALRFRLDRLAAWTEVEEAPPSSGKATMLPPPDEQIRAALERMRQAGQWADVIETAESLVPSHLFWLDLSFYVWEGLDRLGHTEAARVVATDTVEYAGRIRGVEELAFSDGTPFAEDETRRWLREQQRGPDDGRQAGGGDDEMADRVDQAMGEAQKLLGDNRLDAALSALVAPMAKAATLRERFLWCRATARLLSRAKRPRLLMPYVNELLSIIDRCDLEQWDPALAVEGLILALEGLRQQGEQADRARIEAVIDRIALLDPGRAMVEI